MYQNSLGEPTQVRGSRAAAMINNQRQELSGLLSTWESTMLLMLSAQRIRKTIETPNSPMLFTIDTRILYFAIIAIIDLGYFKNSNEYLNKPSSFSIGFKSDWCIRRTNRFGVKFRFTLSRNANILGTFNWNSPLRIQIINALLEKNPASC